MRRTVPALVLTVFAALLLLPVRPAVAISDVLPGQTAPPFAKTQLGGGTVTLADYAGKVVVLFLLGYDCPFCLANAPSVETDVAQYYATSHPGEVAVVGADLWNGTTSQLTGFRDQTGVTFPLLLNGAVATGGNLATLYGTYDNFVIVNRQGVVRYHAATLWPHGNRYHLDEIRGTIDSLVGSTVSVAPGAPAALARLAAFPNPFADHVRLELSLPAAVAMARVALFDVAGRRVASLHEGPLPAGTVPIEWREGNRLDPGIYLAVADLDGRRVQCRIVRLP